MERKESLKTWRQKQTSYASVQWEKGGFLNRICILCRKRWCCLVYDRGLAWKDVSLSLAVKSPCQGVIRYFQCPLLKQWYPEFYLIFSCWQLPRKHTIRTWDMRINDKVSPFESCTPLIEYLSTLSSRWKLWGAEFHRNGKWAQWFLNLFCGL